MEGTQTPFRDSRSEGRTGGRGQGLLEQQGEGARDTRNSRNERRLLDFAGPWFVRKFSLPTHSLRANTNARLTTPRPPPPLPPPLPPRHTLQAAAANQPTAITLEFHFGEQPQSRTVPANPATIHKPFIILLHILP